MCDTATSAAQRWKSGSSCPRRCNTQLITAAANVVRIVRKLGLAGGVHQEQTEGIRLRATDGEQRTDAGTGLELLPRPGEFSLQTLHGAIEHRAVELFLRGEVPVDDFLRDAGGRCHLLHRGAGKPFRRKSGRRALENRWPGAATATRAYGERASHSLLCMDFTPVVSAV